MSGSELGLSGSIAVYRVGRLRRALTRGLPMPRDSALFGQLAATVGPKAGGQGFEVGDSKRPLGIIEPQF